MTDEHDPEYDAHSNTMLDPEEPIHEPGRRRAAKRRRLPGCLAVLVALAVIVGGFYFVVTWGMDKVRDQFGAPEDYPGPGIGRVAFQVHEGDSATAMGSNLEDAGVVASADAFVDAANANPDSPSIQPGYYTLKKKMAAADVVKILVDPDNIVTDTVTIPEGLRVVDTVAILADKTDFSKKDF